VGNYEASHREQALTTGASFPARKPEPNSRASHRRLPKGRFAMRHALYVTAVCVFLIGGAIAQSSSRQADQGAATPAYQPPTTGQEQDIHRNLKDVHFAFNRYELTQDDQQSLEAAANWLKANTNVYITIAGDADERGSIVYNVYLSDKRAKATRDALVSMGVPEDRIVFATGWGKLYPVCNQSDESCWSQNRRAHFEPWQAGSLNAFNLLGTPAGFEWADLSHSNLQSGLKLQQDGRTLQK
jgi:outer membrane protein OmpA-like peptidoglycan-associated protein